MAGARALATLVDCVVFYALYGVLAAFLGTVSYHDDSYWTATMPVGGNIAFCVLIVLYYLVLETRRGQTLGKMLAGVEVIDERTGGRPALVAIAVRTALRLVDGFAGYLVGFVTVLLTPRRQRLGDLAAHTLVVRALGRR